MPIHAPRTPAEWTAYYRLRYEVLRQPWQQPEGSEHVPEDQDPATVHALRLAPDGTAAGVAMLQPAGTAGGQVRFMAVAPAWAGRGVGRALLEYLEAAASQRGYARLQLHAREAAVPFYERLGYTLEAPSHVLFGLIPHFFMTKSLVA